MSRQGLMSPKSKSKKSHGGFNNVNIFIPNEQQTNLQSSLAGHQKRFSGFPESATNQNNSNHMRSPIFSFAEDESYSGSKLSHYSGLKAPKPVSRLR
jgi:hypothetical protein